MIRALALALTFATPLAAQGRMTGAEFEAHVEGRTISFSSPGIPHFGIERYMANRRVMWSAETGECMFGVWYESKGDICFRYEDDPNPHCWTIFDTEPGITGVLTGRDYVTVIHEEPERDDPLICDGLMF